MNWLQFAFIAPILWAIVFVIDTFLVEHVYSDEIDGSVIFGSFQLVPWLLVPFGMIDFVPLGFRETVMAMAAGMLLLFSVFFYFKSLFVLNDAALMQILWNLAVPVVPFLSWAIARETLLATHYAGIGLAFCGTVSFIFKKGGDMHFSRVTIPMFGAVMCLSLYLVVNKEVYRTSPDFWSVFLLFSLGAALGAAILLLFDKKKIKERLGGIVGFDRKYFVVFLLAETLTALGVLSSQKAISLTPSVAFVAVIESVTPVIGMAISFIIVLLLRTRKTSGIEELYRQQLAGIWRKLLSVILIASGIYLIA